MVKRKTLFIFILIACFSLFLVLFMNQTKVMNVKDYGAAGDGVSDDTRAIQRALQNGANHKIHFPTGNYKISKELHINDHTEIEGNNASITASSDLLTVFRVKGKNVRIHDITVNGNNSSLRGITIANGSSDIVISGCTIENFTQPKDPSLSRLTVSGIKLEGGTKNITIDDSKIKNVIARNPIKGWAHFVARGILISPENKQQSTSMNIKISNSTFTNIGPKDDGDGIVVQGFKDAVNLQIINNTFSYNHKRAIKIQSPGVLIKGNKIYNNFYKNNFYTTYPETKTYDMWAAISVYANHVTIKQNTIAGVGNYARIIDVSNASNIKIIKNILKNGYKGNDKRSSIISITSNPPDKILKNFTILDNTFINGRYGVLATSKITNLKIWNNN